MLSFFQYNTTKQLWRLQRIADSFGNEVLLSYGIDTTGRTVWTITDGDRRQRIFFATHQVDGVDVEYVDEIKLTVFGGDRAGDSQAASYHFHYTSTEIMRNGQDSDLEVTSEKVTVPLLTELSLPDGSSFTMAYANDPCSSWVGCTMEPDETGLLRTLTLPTGGGLQWSYQTWAYESHGPWDEHPTGDCVKPDTVIQYQSAGVRERRLLNKLGNPIATWTYTTWEGWSRFHHISEERRTMVVSPEGNATVHYFRANSEKYGNAADFEIPVWDFGLPYTRRYTYDNDEIETDDDL
ncbi:MAG: hypothetical protein GY856_11010, partial [bacterium]|nr:hypothetical protein [bacterium]